MRVVAEQQQPKGLVTGLKTGARRFLQVSWLQQLRTSSKRSERAPLAPQLGHYWRCAVRIVLN
jgi:hypothetical protein